VALPAWLLVVLVAQSGRAPATTASPAEAVGQHVQVSLSIRDGKTVFRSGEPIRLVVSFTADRPGYQVETTVDNNAPPDDQIQISPADGVFRWRELLSTPHDHGRDYSYITALSSQPIGLSMPLNYWFRFDEPGEYTVRVRTRRVRVAAPGLDGPLLPSLTTNEVRFKVVMMTEREEEIEANRLGALLDTLPKNDPRAQTELCEDLAFLTGDAGTREKVRRYLNPQGANHGNWISDLGMGLYISRSTSLVIGLLEADLRDPTRPIAHLMDLVNVRLWMEMPALVAAAQGDMNALRTRKSARLDALRTEYVNEAVASLPQRTRSARRETAAWLVLLLRNYGDAPVPDTPKLLPAVVRKVVIDEFAELDPMTQSYLVEQHWKDIRDPKLLPALESMLASPDQWVREPPMAAILDIAPDRARPLFIAEMLRPRPLNSSAFLELRDQTLPEMDRPLFDQITRLAASSNERDRYELKDKTTFLARYASAAILADVQQLYETRGSELEQGTRVNLHAYLDRWDEVGGAERLERALAAEKDDASLVYGLATTRYSKALDAVIRIRVDSADPGTAEAAALLLSNYGPADGRAVLEARLSRWMNEWSGRSAELEADPTKTSPQASLQAWLIRAILNGKAWKVSETDAALLKQSCVTESCRKVFAFR
jgi:hypothetical protein